MLIITHSLFDVHEIGALGLVICPHDSTRELLDGFGGNLVSILCHLGLS
jgi:hypothetical protein